MTTFVNTVHFKNIHVFFSFADLEELLDPTHNLLLHGFGVLASAGSLLGTLDELANA